MSTRRDKPGFGIWFTAILLCLVVLYLASIGPLVWLGHRDMLPDFLHPAMTTVYAPVEWLHSDGPPPMRDALNWYIELWKP